MSPAEEKAHDLYGLLTDADLWRVPPLSADHDPEEVEAKLATWLEDEMRDW